MSDPEVSPAGLTGAAPRNRFASLMGTAPLDASSEEQIRHRRSRAGNRKANHVIHIAAACQIRLDTPGRAYYRRKLAADKTPMQAMRCLKRRILTPSSTALHGTTPRPGNRRAQTRVREGTAGRLMYPARPASTRTPALRISHFPDPHQRRYPRPTGKTRRQTPRGRLLTTKGSR